MEITPGSGPLADHVLHAGGAVLDEDSLDDLLQSLVVLACRVIPGAHAVSITISVDGSYRTSNSTGSDALAVDEAQYAIGDGPCIEGMRRGVQLQASTAEMHRRWPLVAQRAAGLGVTRVLSTPLFVEGGAAVGALNVYAAQPDRFERSPLEIASLFGRHAGILVDKSIALTSATRLAEELKRAIASRQIIGEAKGILMERQGCTRDEAFDILRRASQRENRKLRDLAEDLVARVEARTSEDQAP